jgi:hypothetical protein
MAKSHRKINRKRRRNSMKGGSAWQFAQSVYGDASSQQAVGPLPNGGTSNLIAMHPQTGGNSLQESVPLEGSPLEGSALAATASPIVGGNEGTPPPPLIVGGNLVPLSPQLYSDNTISNQGLAVLPAVNASAATNILSISGGRRRRRGGNVLGEIAVPATLLVANEFAKNSNMYKSKRSKKSKSNRRRSKRSRR